MSLLQVDAPVRNIKHSTSINCNISWFTEGSGTTSRHTSLAQCQQWLVALHQIELEYLKWTANKFTPCI